MTEDEIRLVQATFAGIGDAGAFGRRFYEHLFRARPDARELFPADLDAQVRKLVDMLESIVRQLRDEGRLAHEFAELGRRHAGYGVGEDDYDDVGAAPLTALREHFGDAFTASAEQAWGRVYGDPRRVDDRRGRHARAGLSAPWNTGARVRRTGAAAARSRTGAGP